MPSNNNIDPGLGGSGSGSIDPGMGGEDGTTSVGYNYGFGSSSSEDIAPSAVQQAIFDAMGDDKGPWTEGKIMYVLYLMQQYGAAVTTVDARVQEEVNKYLTDVQDAWNAVYASESPTASGDTKLTADFLAALKRIREKLDSDPYFDKDESTRDMRQQIIGTLDNAVKVLNDPSLFDPTTGKYKYPNALFTLWKQYDPGSGGGTGTPTLMNSMMRQLSQANEQFTGESQAVEALTKSDAKTWQSEQDILNQFEKLLNKMLQFFVQTQRTG